MVVKVWLFHLCLFVLGCVAQRKISYVAGTGEEGYAGASLPNGIPSPLGIRLVNPGALLLVNDSLFFVDGHAILKMNMSSQQVSIIAGSQLVSGFSGDGGISTAAKLNSPVGMAMDALGNLHVVDSGNHNIRKIDKNTGIISKIAGNETAGSSRENVLAAQSFLNNPVFISFDPSNTLFIAEYGSQRVRKVDPITTNTVTFYSESNLIAPTLVHAVNSSTVYISSSGETRTSFQTLKFIAYQNNNLLFSVGLSASWYYLKQQAISQDQFYVTTCASNSPSDYASIKSFFINNITDTFEDHLPPNKYYCENIKGLTVSPDSVIYFVDDSQIKKIEQGRVVPILGTNSKGPFAGNSPLASQALLSSTRRVIKDNMGKLIFSEPTNHRIRKIDPITGTIFTIAGDGQQGYSGDNSSAILASLNYPNGLAIDRYNNIYVADSGNHRIRKIDTNHTIQTVALPSNISLNNPCSLAIDPFDQLYIADTNNSRILKLVDGVVSIVANSSLVHFPHSIVYVNHTLYVADTYHHRILSISNDSSYSIIAGITNQFGYSADGTLATHSLLHFPTDLTMDSLGNMYIVDFGNSLIRMIKHGIISTIGGCVTCTLKPTISQFATNVTLQGVKYIYFDIVQQELYFDGQATIFTIPFNCLPNGQLINNTCQCYTGWTGEYCQIPVCNSIPSTMPSVCNGKGICVTNDTCTCQLGYYGNHCQWFDCYGIRNTNQSHVCNSNGLCTQPNHCVCHSLQYYGSQCEYPICDGIPMQDTSVCSGNGKCIRNNTCLCNEYSLGRDCSIFTCNQIAFTNTSSVCGGNGTCVGINQCACNRGWEGETCQQSQLFTNTSDSSVTVNRLQVLNMASQRVMRGVQSSLTNGIIVSGTNQYNQLIFTRVSIENQTLIPWNSNIENVTVLQSTSNMKDDTVTAMGYTSQPQQQGWVIKLNSTTNQVVQYSIVSKCNQSAIVNLLQERYLLGWCQGHTLELFNRSFLFSSQSHNLFLYDLIQNQSIIHMEYSNWSSVPISIESTYSQSIIIVGLFNSYIVLPSQQYLIPKNNTLNVYIVKLKQQKVIWSVAYPVPSISCSVLSGSTVDSIRGLITVALQCGNSIQIIQWNDNGILQQQSSNKWSIQQEPMVSSSISISKILYHQQQDLYFLVGIFTGQFKIGYDSVTAEVSSSTCAPITAISKTPFIAMMSSQGKCATFTALNQFLVYSGADLTVQDVMYNNNNNIAVVLTNYRGTIQAQGTVYTSSAESSLLTFVSFNSSSSSVSDTIPVPTEIIPIILGIIIPFVLILVLVIIVGLVVMGVVVYVVKKKKKHQDSVLEEYELNDMLDPTIEIDKSLFEIDFKDLKDLKMIGQGGSGAIVYSCTWQNKSVVVKLFRIHNFGQTNLEDFSHETKLLLSLRHEYIILCYGATLQQNRIGIVLEYCENGSLADYVSKHQTTIPWTQRLTFLLQIATAMEYLHSRNVIHRDLKLENILIDKHLTCKIIDFGLSKTKYHISKSFTKGVGTSYYMAPEVTKGEIYNEKCDVFSFSIIMMELLLGKVNPYITNESVMMMNIEYQVAMNESCRPEIPQRILQDQSKIPFVQMMNLCWRADPEERPKFSEVVIFLQNFLTVERRGEKSRSISKFKK